MALDDLSKAELQKIWDAAIKSRASLEELAKGAPEVPCPTCGKCPTCGQPRTHPQITLRADGSGQE